ncbi:MAG: DNA topoisomerase VI subunit B [Candidatus Woesearchaeota archaeon]
MSDKVMHKEISIAEFFEKNRHLLGFDSPTKALLTSIKEAVDNSLDACEEAKILPEIIIQIIEIDKKRYRLIVEDNGPGIAKDKVAKALGKLLYGSKFHRLKQSRGQQGIGISACILYSQLTTAKETTIVSKTKDMEKAYMCKLRINTKKNEPEIIYETEIELEKESGLKIEMEMEADYSRSAKAIESYLKYTAIANPHATIIYITPEFEQKIFARATEELPKEAKEILPHPYGVELGRFIQMIEETPYLNIIQFLMNSFSRIGEKTAKEICEKAKLDINKNPKDLERLEIEKLYKAMQETQILAPPTDCLSPIGEENLEKGLRKEIPAEFFVTLTRQPEVYRGNPFIVEVGLAYGGALSNDEVNIIRFANKVPLLYQKGACAITRAISEINWNNYGISQPKGGLPVAPLVIVVHIASSWVPYTSEAKEAIAHYPEIISEIKKALQQAARKLAIYVKKKINIQDQLKKKEYLEKYLDSFSEALCNIMDLKSEKDKEQVKIKLKEILEKIKPIEEIEEENTDFEGSGEIIDELEELENEEE